MEFPSMESTAWLWIKDRNCFQNCRWLGDPKFFKIFGDSFKSHWSILHLSWWDTLYFLVYSLEIMSTERLSSKMITSSLTLVTHCTTSEIIYYRIGRVCVIAAIVEIKELWRSLQRLNFSWSSKSPTLLKTVSICNPQPYGQNHGRKSHLEN